MNGRPERSLLPEMVPSTASGQRVLALQVLRFLAASGVIVLHATQVGLGHHQVGWIGTVGPFGVDLFFVLSGVIIARIARTSAPVPFLVMRLTRILPIYWIVTVVWMIFLLAAGTFSWKPLLTSMVLLPTNIDCYLPVAWTLRYELLFYIATALVLFGGRAMMLGLLVTYVAAGIGRVFMPGSGLLAVAGSPLVLEFLAGVLVGHLGARRWSVWLAGVAGLVWLSAVSFSGYSGESDARIILFGLPAALIVYAFRHSGMGGPVMARLAYLGDASYSAYLAHLLPIFLIAPALRSVPAIVSIPGMTILCWGLAVAIHEGVEKPALTLCRRIVTPLFARQA